MKGKRRLFFGGFLLLLTGVIYLIIRSGWLQDATGNLAPRLVATGIHINQIHKDSANIQAITLIDNRTPVGLSIDSIVYSVFINDSKAVESAYPDSLHIAAGDTSVVSLPVTIYYQDLGSKLRELEEEGADSALYRIEATIFADIAPDGKFDINFEKRFPLIKVPEIKVMDVALKDPSFSGVTLVVDILVLNKNVFAFGVDDVQFKLRIAENQPVEGNKASDLYFPANDSVSASIPFELDFEEAGKSLLDWIGPGEDLGYQFTLSAEMVSDQRMLRDSKIILEAEGTVKELDKLAQQ